MTRGLRWKTFQVYLKALRHRERRRHRWTKWSLHLQQIFWEYQYFCSILLERVILLTSFSAHWLSLTPRSLGHSLSGDSSGFSFHRFYTAWLWCIGSGLSCFYILLLWLKKMSLRVRRGIMGNRNMDPYKYEKSQWNKHGICVM